MECVSLVVYRAVLRTDWRGWRGHQARLRHVSVRQVRSPRVPQDQMQSDTSKERVPLNVQEQLSVQSGHCRPQHEHFSSSTDPFYTEWGDCFLYATHDITNEELCRGG